MKVDYKPGRQQMRHKERNEKRQLENVCVCLYIDVGMCVCVCVCLLCAVDHGVRSERDHHFIVLTDLLQSRNCDENSSNQGQLNFDQYAVTIVSYMCVLVSQSCPTLCYSMDYSPPGSSVHGILQARILEWVAIPFSRGSS